jgi:integrase
MPRQAEGARLYQRPDRGIWVIRDTGCPDRSTGTRDRREAQNALAAYIAGKGVVTGPSHPDRFQVADALAIYGREHAVTRAAPERIGYAIDALVAFWGSLSIADVKGETCRRYAKSRVRRFADGTTQPIADGTIRRELNVLQAAINYCHREGYLIHPAAVTLPNPPPAKDRWLTRDEAAKLIWTAYRSAKGKHLARFILIALYTGTRKEAILRLGFMRNTAGGWIDTTQGVIYRRGTEERQTKKLRPPMRLSRRLLSHCRRWEGTGAVWAVSFEGQRVGDIKRAFESARDAAGMPDVTPHTLKHTAITWAMQRGMRIEDAADYFGTSVETIRRVYYHHSPNYQDDAVAIMDRETVPRHRYKAAETA